jgi:hypothetical protein
VALAVPLANAACVTSKPAEQLVGVSTVATAPADAPPGEAPKWAFDSLDARPVSAEAMRGKPTVLLFAQTDNLGSQAEVNYLVAMAKNDGDAVHYVLVALQPHKDRELVELYRKTLAVTFPVALADDATLHGSGSFPLEAVPTLVVLDREGRIVWRTTGIARPVDIRAHLNNR